MASALWWRQWNEVLAVFVEGFLLTFAGGVVILKIHICMVQNYIMMNDITDTQQKS